MASDPEKVVTARSMQMTVTIVLREDGSREVTLVSQYLEQPFICSDLVELIGKMNVIFDDKRFPQSYTTPRSFGFTRTDFPKSEERRTATMPSSTESGNMKCSFEINVMYRQNATWQGNILWLEKNKRQNFRSALEMIGLMNEAVNEGIEQTAHPGWD